MTPSKGERTRDRIVAAAAPLFNQRGYAGVSMQDIMAAVRLEKGGLYRHFESKDDLALAALDHAIALNSARIHEDVERERGAVARLAAFGAAVVRTATEPALPGGCPLLNTAIECDDASGAPYAVLRQRTRAGMRRLIDYVAAIIARGIADEELDPDLDPAREATAIVGAMEGALMLAKLYDDPTYVRQAAERLARQAALLARSAAR